ncbi:MAG: ABC transporter permease subunit, partial [Anaerolineaceae bacterium]
TLLTALIGIIVGAVSAMSGGRINQFSMRFTDGILCFPVIAGIAFFQQLIDMTRITQTGDVQMFLSAPFTVNTPQALETSSFFTNLNPVMLALIVLCWVPYARTLNLLILQTKRLEFITAAQASGASTWRIFLRHILPNTSAPLIVLATKDIGQMVVLQTTFSFVGFSGMSAWATPLLVSRSWIIGIGGNPWSYWWVYLPITLAIILFALGWNLLGDELNYWLNPRKN